MSATAMTSMFLLTCPALADNLRCYRNNNPKLRTLTLDPDARGVPWDTVIRFDVDGGRIMKLERVYLP
jgi:hypothetical protein